MSVEVSKSSKDLLGRAGARPVRRASRTAAWWLVGLAALTAAYVPLVVVAASPAPLRYLPWLLAPYAAMVAWGNAAMRVRARARLAFWALAMTAAAGVVTQLVWMFEAQGPGRPDVPIATFLFLIPYTLLALGTGLSLAARRGRVWSPGLTADALLLLLAGLVVVLRLAVEPLLSGPRAEPGHVAMLGVLQTLGLIPVFLATLLVLRRRSSVSPPSAVALLCATVAFAVGAMLSASGFDTRAFSPGQASHFAWLGGWVFLALGGAVARTVPATGPEMLAGRWAQDRVRKLILPAAALFLSIAVVDLALRPGARPETVAAIAALGVLLALRTAHAFSIVDREAEQRRQLAHTRALVDVTHSLAGTTDLDATLEVISCAARTVLGTRAAGIELVTDDGATLETRAVVGLPDGVVGLRFPVEGSFTGWVVQHGEPRATVDPSRDPYIQPESLDFLGTSPVAAAPIRFRGETLGAIFACIRSEPFDAEELSLLGALAEQAAIAIQNARLFEQVIVLSITDPLTGLSNRRQLERDLAREVAAARRGRPLAAVIFDLDDFKLYNDAHGHLAGDEALQAFGATLREESRAMNLTARYGGDEFVALLSDSDMDGARIFVERVRNRFREAVLRLGRGEIGVSAGIAAYEPGMENPEALLRRADEGLYREKPRVRT